MSGGSYNYAYRPVSAMAESITGSPLRAAFADHLRLVAHAMLLVEWVDSGDLGKGYEDAAIRACLDGEPHGFTHNDLWLVEKLAGVCELWASTPQTEKAARHARDLANRMRALLPPNWTGWREGDAGDAGQRSYCPGPGDGGEGCGCGAGCPGDVGAVDGR